MTALRTAAQQALEALNHVNVQDRVEIINNLRAALAEPVQEPVACVRIHKLLAWIIDECVVYPESPDEKAFAKRLLDAITHPKSGLNAPPQRKPPIADEALWEMWVDSPSDVLAFARRIEMWHGIT